MSSLLEVENLTMILGGERRFLGKPRPAIRAVDGVDLALGEQEMLGIVGESGCGKSTLAKTILGLYRETSGTIRLDGKVVSGLNRREARNVRRDIQYVHQDPGAALDPWWNIGHTLDEGLRINGVGDRDERSRRIDTMLEAVGLNSSFKSRYPHELSGGQQRRVGLARILVLHPRIVLLDEPTSGLDLSVQATVLNLLQELRARFGLTYIFISHDLSVVERMCDRVAIMYLGKIVEIAATKDIFTRRAHPYTRALLNSTPRLKAGQLANVEPVRGEPPSAAKRPAGCVFSNRCPFEIHACHEAEPPLLPVAPGHQARCIRIGEI